MGSSSSPQFKLPCFWKWIQIISGELMATGWEVGCKDWEQDVCFRLLDQTKEVVWGNPQSLYFTQQTPRHRPVLQSLLPELCLAGWCEDTWSHCRAGQGRRGSAPRPRMSAWPDGMWHLLQTLEQCKVFPGVSSHPQNCHCCPGAAAAPGTAQLPGFLPWLHVWMSHCPAQHSLFYPTEQVSKHHTAPQTRHNYLVTDTHNCDGAAIVWVSWTPHARRKGGIKHSSFFKIPEKKNNGSILHFTFHCMHSLYSWSFTLLQRDDQHLPRHQWS